MTPFKYGAFSCIDAFLHPSLEEEEDFILAM